MKISDVRLEMELDGVDEADIAEIVTMYDSQKLTDEMLDDELLKRGYERLFTTDYDEYDEWNDDDCFSIEKFPYKHHYRD